MAQIIRDSLGRITGTSKNIPTWATAEQLKRLCLLPSLKQMAMVESFYLLGRSAGEVAREHGVSVFAVRTLLMRVRRALGIAKDQDREPAIRGRRRAVLKKHDQFGEGFERERARWGSRGRRYHPEISREQLQQLFTGPAMVRYRIAVAYWLQAKTAKEVGAEVGLDYRAVEFQVARLRRMAEGHRKEHVIRSRTKAGKVRTGITSFRGHKFFLLICTD